MNEVVVADIEPGESAGEAVRRELTDALGTTDVAINRYTLEPGDRISGLHGHGDQEEVFLVVEGAATFETYAPPCGEDSASEATGDTDEVRVDSGAAVRFPPGKYQSGRNPTDGTSVLYAIGAPRDSEDVRIPLDCPECGHEYRRPTVADERAPSVGRAGSVDPKAPVLACPDCGHVALIECPECGGTDLTATLADAESPISRCRDCGVIIRDV